MSELQQLRDRVCELEELLGLTAEFPRHLLPRGTFRLNICEPLLGLLLARPFVSQQAAYDACYGGRPECDQPDIKQIQVAICYLRKGLASKGIEVSLDRGQGYYMTDENKSKLRALIAESEAKAA